MLILIAALACGIALARDPYLRTDRDMIAIVGWAESLKVNQALFYFVLLLVCITPLTSRCQSWSFDNILDHSAALSFVPAWAGAWR